MNEADDLGIFLLTGVTAQWQLNDEDDNDNPLGEVPITAGSVSTDGSTSQITHRLNLTQLNIGQTKEILEEFHAVPWLQTVLQLHSS
jgi:hypothetical protein